MEGAVLQCRILDFELQCVSVGGQVFEFHLLLLVGRIPALKRVYPPALDGMSENHCRAISTQRCLIRRVDLARVVSSSREVCDVLVRH